MKRAAGFFGAGVACLFSALLISNGPAVYALLRLRLMLGLIRPTDIAAGPLPAPLGFSVGWFLLLLALLCFILAALFYFLRRAK